MTTLDPYGALVTRVERETMPGPLNGLAVGVKDLIAVAGVPRLCGAPGIVDPAPQQRDAVAVARLVEAGAAIVATTATHKMGWGVTTPGTINPRAPDRIAGGSSGGSAAALAAGLVDGALGTDTAGSIRIPAACCGVVGLRTTEGLVPIEGVQPLAPTLDSVGPMARDVATVARLLSALVSRPVEPAMPATLRVGVVDEISQSPIDADVRDAWRAALDALTAAGARISTVSLPLLPTAREATIEVLAAEEAKTHAATLRDHADKLSQGVVEALESGARIPHERVLQARRDLALFRDQIGGVFSKVDVLIVPVLPCVVPAVDAKDLIVEGLPERTGSALTRCNTPFSGAGLPAGALPVAVDAGGAPIGLQLVGAWRTEELVLGAMALLERVSGGPWPAIGHAA